MASSVVPVANEQLSREVEFEAGRGNLEKATEHFANIAVPLFRARALDAIAKRHPDLEQAVASWLRAVANARRARRGVVDELRPLGIEVLNRLGRSEEGKALSSRIEAIDARWELEIPALVDHCGETPVRAFESGAKPPEAPLVATYPSRRLGAPLS